ncbi:acyl-CoA dehydrogenase [Arthrobacter sp. TPD3018]|jgi:alkylation response protein AidB-like acyl-CoA dehydrogenase|uniref:acyl-CoA/acyl-ACP dehydrogenase n=2 Tax=cellular organisms TaxID=131567 RepID=UPI000D525007|nr:MULTISPECIES: acyl-CoA/acyl-ACP dehydrogenase [Bacteria]PVE51314.1 acyl-CoA dehydrogenase [Arthrobacter sp. TPD3018]PVE51525.1 acyl-CoA dehydrogenase [Sphingomonas sp. TPD3009]PVE80460.1 acyl-CoA dehydrogenase [Sphingomonas melonis]
MTAIKAELGNAIETAGWSGLSPADPETVGDYMSLLRQLYRIGRTDLPLGRLIEGHVDACQILRRYGTHDQLESARASNRSTMVGVWNAALEGEPLRVIDGCLAGGKSFASGAGVLTHALVTADTPAGTQLLLLDLARTSPEIDRSWWHVTGMQRSETHIVRWNNVRVCDHDFIGKPGDYAREPHFSGGALRFTAVHAGGIAGVFDRTRDHLISTNRAQDPFQAARLAALFQLAEAAAATIQRTATAWFDGPEDARLARVAAARLSVADAATRSIAIAQEAVGLAGHFRSHPLSTLLTDLTVYLRQPAPDAQVVKVGEAARQGLLVLSL